MSPPAQALGVRRWCVLVAWFGCSAGYAELGIQSLKRLFNEPIEVDGLRYWMAPAANVLVFAGAGALVALANAVRRPAQPTQRYLWTWFALWILASSLHHGGIMVIANVLLACGIAYRIERVVARRIDRFYAFARRTATAMVALVVVSFAAITGHDCLEWRGDRSVAAARGADPYNVLLIVMDTVRAESTSLCGHTRATTPHLDALAASSTTFRTALSTSSWTLPSHASMFTGRYPHELSTSWTYPLTKTHPVVAEVFHDHGYQTAGFAANLLYCTREFGLPRGFDYYEANVVGWSELAFHSIILQKLANSFAARSIFGKKATLGAKTAEDINRSFLGWVDLRERRPFFAFLNYMDAHEPYAPPAPYAKRFFKITQKPHAAQWQYYKRGAQRYDKARQTLEETDAQVAAYEGAIAYMDAAIHALLQDLESRGLLERTVVIVTSDHGEQFGEHQQFSHGSSLYSQETRVPLLIHAPTRCPTGLVVHRPVTLRDLPTTMLDLAGIASHGGIGGHSILRDLDTPTFLLGRTSPVLSVLGTYSKENPAPLDATPETHALLRDGYRAFRLPRDDRRLFDWGSDPGEAHDLATAPEHGPRTDRLLAELREMVRPTD